MGALRKEHQIEKGLRWAAVLPLIVRSVIEGRLALRMRALPQSLG